MTTTRAEQSRIENEIIFRCKKEKVGDDLGALDAKHIEDGNCTTRIPLQLSGFQFIHSNRDKSVVRPDHEIDSIEKILKKTPEYTIVKKNNSAPESNDTLKYTLIDNS